jgi:heat-inducible transcriptional repressor
MTTLTDRQIKILCAIVEKYINFGTPISSNELINDYFKSFSPATVRNEMFILEKNKLLEKVHTSSGRIPTIDGFKFYESKILKPKLENSVKIKLLEIFKKRNSSVDSIIDQSVQLIGDALQLPSVISLIKKNEKLKRFDVVQINSKSALIIIITSSGDINKTIINFNKKHQIDDISTCVRIFNDRLIDTNMQELKSKIMAIKEIIRKSVNEYEFCIQQLIEKIVTSYKIENDYISTIKGVK